MSTIYALSTAPGKAGLAVIRVSGPVAFAAAEHITGHRPSDRSMALRTFRVPDGSVIDQGLLLSFPAPGSFTGENIVEFQCHGSIAVVKAMLATLDRMPDLRAAEPGEFTRRALENDRLDLVQVEALSDLIDAETDLQRRQAMSVLSGQLSDKIATWRADLIKALSLIEAVIDFSEEDVPEDTWSEAKALLSKTHDDLKSIAQSAQSSDRLRHGYSVVILGPPNAGKSTLLNALTGRETAITSAIPGTTRDVVETFLDWKGLPIILRDTAGLRDTDDEVESIGVARARNAADTADLRIYLLPEGADPQIPPRPQDLIVGPKADLGGSRDLNVSGLTGEGVEQLIAVVAERLRPVDLGQTWLLRDRYRDAIAAAAADLDDAITGRDGLDGEEIIAESIRSAIFRLDRLIGRVVPDDVLDDIFSSFCIGK
ncbi:tRNA uridine-5-carboxymethylaminomethyl(34) synthesis GTPase MnmE [Aestuariibius sp. 2305UL40-4]|uniref:tRNA uridine-5-carboxymethylaminomethyl(34) synthesis GTPase MnmE n=1 Tax=Aestuariibius violaceus TaxID=3234132 RepID=UPI00345E145B